MSIPNDPLSFLSFLVGFFFSTFTLGLIHIISEEIGTLRSEISERGRDICTLGHLEGLVPTHFQLTFLLFPFRVEELDTHMFGKFVLGDRLTTIWTFRSKDSSSSLDTCEDVSFFRYSTEDEIRKDLPFGV